MDVQRSQIRAGMVGMGMIFDETYRPFFESAHSKGIYDRTFGDVDVSLVAVATKTGRRADAYQKSAGEKIYAFRNSHGEHSVREMLDENLTFACVATPDSTSAA